MIRRRLECDAHPVHREQEICIVDEDVLKLFEIPVEILVERIIHIVSSQSIVQASSHTEEFSICIFERVCCVSICCKRIELYILVVFFQLTIKFESIVEHFFD